MLALLTVMFSCAAQNSDTVPRANLVASGLTCSMCSNAIFKALTKLPFVDKVSPDVEHSSFMINFKNSGVIVLDDLQKAVMGAGFSVDTLTLFLNLNGVNIHDNDHMLMHGIFLHFVHVPTKTLTGQVSLRIIDKGFIPDAAYKQYVNTIQLPCYKTGKSVMNYQMGTLQVAAGTREYHVTY
jgi:copper chaperone CopZ